MQKGLKSNIAREKDERLHFTFHGYHSSTHAVLSRLRASQLSEGSAHLLSFFGDGAFPSLSRLVFQVVLLTFSSWKKSEESEVKFHGFSHLRISPFCSPCQNSFKRIWEVGSSPSKSQSLKLPATTIKVRNKLKSTQNASVCTPLRGGG